MQTGRTQLDSLTLRTLHFNRTRAYSNAQSTPGSTTLVHLPFLLCGPHVLLRKKTTQQLQYFTYCRVTPCMSQRFEFFQTTFKYACPLSVSITRSNTTREKCTSHAADEPEARAADEVKGHAPHPVLRALLRQGERKWNPSTSS